MQGFDSAGDDDGPIASINIVPFVDIVLVLLVIFMLTSSHILRASLEVQLPEAASAGARVESTVNLVYTADAELLFNGERTTFAEARARIQREASANPKLRAAIGADRGVAYGRVIELIDLVQSAGIHSFALDVERPTSAEVGAP